MVNYQKICLDLLQDLPQRQKEIILRRFGLKEGQRETLESIGQDLGITRERVRQIEEDGFLKLEPKISKYQNIFQFFWQYLKKYNGLRRETTFLEEVGGKIEQPQIYFLLTIGKNFERIKENADFHSLWTIDQDSFFKAKEAINFLLKKLAEIKKPLSSEEISLFCSFEKPALESYLGISKRIQSNSEGLFGLKDWPEINPRGIKDRAYLVFKKAGQPLHFSEVAGLIVGGGPIPTVHNELIRDSRFVLVGRGIYALREWGYYPGEVKEVIAKILKEEGSLTREEILEKVLAQRMVKENTILLNLNNKKYFFRDSQSKYKIREV